MAVGAQEDADLRVLQVARRTVVGDVLERILAGQRQLQDLVGRRAKTVEFPHGFLGLEILDVHLAWHR